MLEQKRDRKKLLRISVMSVMAKEYCFGSLGGKDEVVENLILSLNQMMTKGYKNIHKKHHYTTK